MFARHEKAQPRTRAAPAGTRAVARSLLPRVMPLRMSSRRRQAKRQRGNAARARQCLTPVRTKQRAAERGSAGACRCCRHGNSVQVRRYRKAGCGARRHAARFTRCRIALSHGTRVLLLPRGACQARASRSVRRHGAIRSPRARPTANAATACYCALRARVTAMRQNAARCRAHALRRRVARLRVAIRVWRHVVASRRR